MTWRVVTSCRQTMPLFGCDYCHFSASNVQCPRTVELGIMSCKWNYSVNYGSAWGLSWRKHIIARLCLWRICSLNLPPVRHSRDESDVMWCDVMALPCRSSSYAFPRCYVSLAKPIYHTPITYPHICRFASEMQTNKGIFHYPKLPVSVNTGVPALSDFDGTHSSVRGTVTLKSLAEHPNWPKINYIFLGTGDKRLCSSPNTSSGIVSFCM